MPAPKGPGIADDAADFEDLPSASALEPGASRPPRLPKRGASVGRGIADDASSFEGLVRESTDAARTLDSDWLYKKDGHVFGPIKPRALLELLYAGEVDGDTPIAVADGEFEALGRYGVFRAHLPKAKLRQQELAEQRAEEARAAGLRLQRRLRWSLLAVLLAGVSAWGLMTWVRARKEAQARAESKAQEAALLAEVDQLMASVSIEPPLVELVEAPPKGDADSPARRERRRGVARFSGGARTAAGPVGTGELKRDEIMAGVASVFPQLKRCIVEQIQRDSESVPEQLVLSFGIANDGVPQGVDVDRSLRGTPLRDCIVKQVGAIRFRSYKGEVQNVEYPISIGRH